MFTIYRNEPWMIFLCLVIILITVMSCSTGAFMQGQYFPSLAYPEGDGTLLFFYLENTEYYQPKDDLFGESENLETLIAQIKLDLSMLKEKYPKLRIFLVDIYQKRGLAAQHQIYEIPIVLLYDNMGYEVRRWLPIDFKRGGGTTREMERLVEKIKSPK